MRNISFIAFFVLSSLLIFSCRSGLVTMTNSCRTAIKTGQSDNASGNYSAAADKFTQVLKQCDAYDAKEQANAGLATAYNGMKQYNQALDAANSGLKVNKSSVDNLFQHAAAEVGLNNNADAKADFAQIIDLTQKNRNTKDKATIYAKMAQLDLQQNMYSDAMNNVQTAINTDNTNADFYILKGDIYAAQNDYTNAMTAYDQAVTSGGNTSKVWQAKVEAETKALQKKYATGSNASNLAGKLSASEKQSLCADIRKAKNAGVQMQSIDLLQLSICK